jgi:4-amino-4-deoxy-L-arabinose transferase-like glycosyltransferase
MALGIGSFWKPFFAESFWLPYDNGPFFFGHPPLQFWLQSLLFRIMGDSIAVENIYNFIILVSSVTAIVKIWQKFFEENADLRSYSWLPVLCWYALVIVYYSIPNNFLDSTMALFCMLSCYFQLRFLKQKDKLSFQNIWLLLAAGTSIFLACLTKGPVGLYPLAFSMIYIIVYDRGQFIKGIKITFIVLATLLVLLSITLLYKPAYAFLSVYFEGQVVQALLQKREKAGKGLAGHLYLLTELLRNIYPHLAALAGLYLLGFLFKTKTALSSEVIKIFQVMLLVAGSAILPILLSIKQYPHYLLPSLPFVAILFAALYVEKVNALIAVKTKLAVTTFRVAILVCWVFTVFKLTNMEGNAMAANAKELKHYVARTSKIGVCHDLYQLPDVHAYLQRYLRLSLTTNIRKTKYILADNHCLHNFDLRKNKVVTLEGDLFLVIKNPETHSQHAVYQSKDGKNTAADNR